MTFTGKKKIITFGGEKGGTGKTTICTNSAVYLKQRGVNVAILDADPKPASATFCRRRKGTHDEFIEAPDMTDMAHKKLIARKVIPGIIPCERVRGDIMRSIESMANEFDVLLIDAGGMDEEEQRIGIALSDTLICPIKTGQYDLDTAPRMNSLVQKAKIFNKGLRSYFVVNEASTNPMMNNTDEAREILRQFDSMIVADTIIRKRNAFEVTASHGLGVIEWSDSKARAEMELFCQEVING
ncbi:division plane positioning ATPase MipZ [Dongshaea marina]|uniref:division plane positioning ATPase MipZ n=1 Tax=Dongshaea marina TaxID=2047966 RepID=UPI000D3EBAD9|nr:division plane positioning ATPase MipZ [Dongshaea marina]